MSQKSSVLQSPRSVPWALTPNKRIVSQMLARRPEAEAVVVTGGAQTPGTRALLGALDIPVIEIWDVPARPLGPVVGFSKAEAMRPVVAHLARKGRRRIAFLGARGDTDQRGAERRRGVVEAARDLGLPEVTILDAGPAPVSMSEGARAIAALGPAVSSFDAIVRVSDPVAFGALTVCQALGLDVPRDIAITGFGAFEIASICRPALTAVDVGAAAIRRAAGRHIALRLRMEEGQRAEVDLRTSVRFIEGQSS